MKKSGLQRSGSKSLFSELETIKSEARNWSKNQAQMDEVNEFNRA
jgi:hypothetical protein